MSDIWGIADGLNLSAAMRRNEIKSVCIPVMEAFIKGINRQMTKLFDPLHIFSMTRRKNPPLHVQGDVCYRAYASTLNGNADGKRTF